VQGVWDQINSYWPEIAAKERRVTGVEPEKVEGDPFQTVTADGQTLQLPGGYYPIKYDTDRSTRSEADDAAEHRQGDAARRLHPRDDAARPHQGARRYGQAPGAQGHRRHRAAPHRGHPRP
jgi:hypothetical protein